jgi:hypothetical protein
MVDRHSLNLKPLSARTLYVYAHADLAQKYSVGLQENFVSRLCSQEENSFFLPCQYFISLAKFLFVCAQKTLDWSRSILEKLIFDVAYSIY